MRHTARGLGVPVTNGSGVLNVRVSEAPSNNEMHLTGGGGGSRGVGLAIRRAGYPVRARVVVNRRPQVISVFGGQRRCDVEGW